MARTEVRTVVQSSPAIPKRSSSPATVQFREVRKLSWFGLQAGQRESQQEDADEEHQQDDDQAGVVGQAAEDPVAGLADLGQLDAPRCPL